MVKKVWWNPKCIFYSSQKEKPARTAVIQSLLLCKMPLLSSYCAKFKFHLPLVCQFISKREDQSANYVSCLSFIYLFLMCIASKILPSPLHMCFFLKYLCFLLSDSFAVLLFMSDQTSHARRVNLARAHRKLGTWNVTLWLCRLGCTNVTEPGAS